MTAKQLLLDRLRFALDVEEKALKTFKTERLRRVQGEVISNLKADIEKVEREEPPADPPSPLFPQGSNGERPLRSWKKKPYVPAGRF